MISLQLWLITDMVKRSGCPLKLTKSENFPFFPISSVVFQLAMPNFSPRILLHMWRPLLT